MMFDERLEEMIEQEPRIERRRRLLTDADVEAIVSAMGGHRCRYDIDPKEMDQALHFVNSLREVLTESGSVVRKTIVGFAVLAMLGLVVLGFWSKVKQVIGS